MSIYQGYQTGSCGVDAMKGETLVAITGMDVGSELVKFRTASGRRFVMWYEHDCCASCSIEDVAGDVDDLIGSPLVISEDVSSDPTMVEGPKPEYEDSSTWTFVKFATVKGYVTLRWYGASNGYYSEEPSFREIE